jgi:hypothetical protein
MKAITAASLLALQLAASAAAAQDQPAPEKPASSLRAKLTDTVIKEAVRESLADNRENPLRHEADVLRADKYQVFTQEFHEARVPDCLHEDALKRQPHSIGPFVATQLFAVPFVVLAKLRGKCR